MEYTFSSRRFQSGTRARQQKNRYRSKRQLKTPAPSIAISGTGALLSAVCSLNFRCREIKHLESLEEKAEALRLFAQYEGFELDQYDFSHLSGDRIQAFAGDISDALIQELVDDDLNKEG